MSCYKHEVENVQLNWVNKIIISNNKYEVTLHHKMTTSTVTMNREDVLYLLSYCYSKDAVITDLNDYSFITHHTSIRRTIWSTADMLGRLLK